MLQITVKIKYCQLQLFECDYSKRIGSNGEHSRGYHTSVVYRVDACEGLCQKPWRSPSIQHQSGYLCIYRTINSEQDQQDLYILLMNGHSNGKCALTSANVLSLDVTESYHHLYLHIF